MTTFNEHGAEMMNIIERQLDEVGRDLPGRDLALARTHLEDALTRYNSAQYHRRGTWKRADPDK